MTAAEDTGIVEMAWDPITRIVGSLGIYTKIDFSQKKVVECHSTSSIFRGYSIFMKGKDPQGRALHHQPDLRHLRRQPRNLLGLQPEHGLRRAPAAPRRVDHQPRRGRGVHVRPQHLPGEPGRGGLLRADGQRDQPRRARAGQPHRGAARRRARLRDHRRHHADAEPARRRVLPRGAAGEQVHQGDVLPDGGAPRAPLDAVPRRRGHHGHHPAVHRLPHPADALRGVHEARSSRCTTTCSTSSTRPCPATRRSAAAAPTWSAGAASTTPSTATSPTGT